jgi:hypothetical protein
MPRPSLLLASSAFALAAALVSLAGCSPAKPADAPEGSSEPAAKDKPESEGPKAGNEEAATRPAAETGGEHEHAAPPKSDVDRSMSLDTYEMTPSDCNALGRHYGDVARSDQMVGLSPKLSEAQRSATAAQIDKVVGTLEGRWTDGCHASLVNKAVDHDNIKCALAAKTVKDFDVCLNGAAGTPQVKAPGKKKN